MRLGFTGWTAVAFMLGSSACGDDDVLTRADDAGRGNTSLGGSGAQRSSIGTAGEGASAAAGNNSSVAGGVIGSVICGSKTCTAPGGGFASPCCVDAETETCGTSFMGAVCSVPSAGDERCPAVMGFVTLPSCCTASGMCGINAAMFGMPGCIELSEAAMRAQMSSVSSFPAPRRCDGGEVAADGDAGTSDEDGGT
jgi:hypothetical protein